MATIPFTSTLKELPRAQRQILVEIPAPALETCVTKAIARLAQELEVEGFRKGKVPPHLAERYLRADAILEEAAHIAIHETYADAVRHHALEPIGRPDIEVTKVARGDTLAYTVMVSVLEEAKLPEWRKMKAAKKPMAVEPKEVEDALAYIMRSRTKYVAVTRPAALGDFVEIDFAITRDGVPIENGSETKHPFTLGEGRFIPGFEDAIVGMQTGEEKTVPLTFPADYHEKSLAGAAVIAALKVNAILEKQMPPRDDAFAKSVGAFETFAALELSVREGILREKTEHEQHRARMEVLEKIADKTKVESPEILVVRETEKMFADLEERLASTGLALEGYLEHLKKTREELAHDWHGEAEKRVKIGLTLRALAKTEMVNATDEEIEEKMQETLKRFADPDDAKKQHDVAALREYAEGALINEKVLALIEKECVTDGK